MYTIRYATSSDAKVLGEIHAESWKVAYKNIIPDDILSRITPKKRGDYFTRVIAEGKEKNALILHEDEATGFITLGKCRDEELDDTYGEVWGIYLSPKHWQKGIGTRLINWGLKELKEQGYNKVTLWVLEENFSARKFYEKMGFIHDGRVKDITIGIVLKEYRYVKDLR